MTTIHATSEADLDKMWAICQLFPAWSFSSREYWAPGEAGTAGSLASLGYTVIVDQGTVVLVLPQDRAALLAENRLLTYMLVNTFLDL